jgi:Rod binding domain-containing protein
MAAEALNANALSNGQVPRQPAGQEDKARQTAEAFEAMFLTQMLGHMTSGIPVDPAFGGGPGEKAFRSMLNDEYAKSIAKQGGVGIADVIYREILRLQEVQ